MRSLLLVESFDFRPSNQYILVRGAVVDSGEVGRSAGFSRYNNGPRTLPWGTPALTDVSSMYSVSTFTRKCLLCK
jgi:hypothetical protein